MTQLSKAYKFFIVEDELADEPILLIGTILNIGTSDVKLRYFTGAGNWDEVPSKLRFNRISSCQVNTNYLNVYARHFVRTEPR